MNRIELNQKYYICGNQASENYSSCDLIKYYENYQTVLFDLLDDLKAIEGKTSIVINELNTRQKVCINRCSREFIESSWSRMNQKYTQTFYEMTDFMYYPGYKYNELAHNEIKIIRIMAAYLIMKADEIMYGLKYNYNSV